MIAHGCLSCKPVPNASRLLSVSPNSPSHWKAARICSPWSGASTPKLPWHARTKGSGFQACHAGFCVFGWILQNRKHQNILQLPLSRWKMVKAISFIEAWARPTNACNFRMERICGLCSRFSESRLSLTTSVQFGAETKWQA